MSDNTAALVFFLSLFLGIPALCLLGGYLNPPQPKKDIRIIIVRKDSMLDLDRDDWKNIVAEELP